MREGLEGIKRESTGLGYTGRLCNGLVQGNVWAGLCG